MRRLTSLLNDAATIAINGVALLFIIPVLFFALFWFSAHFIESPTYAFYYFENAVETEDILESRKWIWGSQPAGNGMGCTYAIATLPQDASEVPPSTWPLDWIETPVQIFERGTNPIATCASLWPIETRERLLNAQANTGSYYDADHDTFWLYSFEEKIVARVRFGD